MVTVNNIEVEWEENLTVEKLLQKMNYTFSMIVVKVNGEIVPKNDWPEYRVPDNAIVQAHHLIAGG